MRRSIGIVFSDGGLLALTSTLPAGGREHGDEEVAAVLCDPDGAPLELRGGAALDRVRRGRRAAAGDAGAVARRRGDAAAARRRHADQLGRASSRRGLDSEIAFFRWSVEGREGLGTYEVARGADG